MKTAIHRYLITLIGIISCYVVPISCTNSDNIDVSYDTQLCIDLLGVTNSFTYQLYNEELNNIPNNQKIEVMLFVYEVKTGEFVYRTKEYASSYNNTIFFYPNISTLGDYKAIVITRIVSNDGFSYWEVTHSGNIENLRIIPNIDSQDFGLSQILGIGTADVKPSKLMSIPVNPAGGLLIPRIICSEDFTVNYDSLKLSIPKFYGEYTFNKDGNYSYRNNKIGESCILEMEPRKFYVESWLSYHALYTYKFVPVGCELNIELNSCSPISDNNLMGELFDYRDYEVNSGKEYVWYVRISNSGFSTILGDATNKDYGEECKNQDALFGYYTNEYGHDLKCRDTQIGRIQGILYQLNN